MTTRKEPATSSNSLLSLSERIVVTGVAGFIGSNLAARLIDEGYTVTGIDDLSQGLIEQIPTAVDFHQADIRSPEIQPLMSGARAVFHLAAKNCVSDCQLDPVTTAGINVSGAVAVFEAARVAGVPHVIHAESSALYEGSACLPSGEDDVAPLSHYAVSKYASGLFAAACARFSGMALTRLRYFNVYGPRQDYRRSIPPVMSAFILNLLAGRAPTIYGDGSKRRDFIHVDDVNDFHMLCLSDEQARGGVYNLGTGVNYSVLEVYALIAELLGTTIRPLHGSELEGEAFETLADITRARAFGWAPRVEFRSGLRGMIDYLERRVAGGQRAAAPLA
ncbi:MAG: NAD-dependent epimerase/dehydratase family protein [Gemmatimonadota bacterium]